MVPEPQAWLALGLGLAFVTLSAMAETALGAVNRVQLRDLPAYNAARGAAVDRLIEDPAPVWAALVVTHTLGLALTVVGAVALLLTRRADLGPTGALWLAGLVVSLVLVQVLARFVAARRPETVALLLAAPVAALARPLRPVLVALGLVERLADVALPVGALRMREDELRVLVNVGEDAEPIEEEEREMIAGIFGLGDTKVREVMVPRIDIVAIPIDATLDDALGTIIAAGHSRIPVHRESIDDVAGLLYAKDLLKAFRKRDFEPDLGSMLRPAYFIPESKPVDELLEELQARQVHMAIVVDEYGGTAGLVTIEDLIEEIVGEIQDEYDREEPRIELLSDDEGLFHAGVDIDDVNRLMDIDLPTDEVDTLAGLVFTSLGRVPDVGDRARLDDADIVVLALTGRRIKRVRVVCRRGESPVDATELALVTRVGREKGAEGGVSAP